MAKAEAARGARVVAEGSSGGTSNDAFAALRASVAAILRSRRLDDAAVDALAIRAAAMLGEVPADRRADWQKIVSGFLAEETQGRRRARLAKLMVACDACGDGAPAKRRARSSESASIDAPVGSLPGVGAAASRALNANGVRTVGDLLLVPPVAAIDLRAPVDGASIVAAIRAGARPIAVRGTVERVSVIPLRGRRAIRVALRSGDALVELWWFFASPAARRLTGEIVAIGNGSIDPKRGVVRIAHPRTIAIGAGSAGVEPIYALKKVPAGVVSNAAKEALARLDVAPLDPWPTSPDGDLATVLRHAHAPSSPEENARAREALRRRLAFAEACWLVSRRIARDRALARRPAAPLPFDRKMLEALIGALGFAPTNAQRRAMEEIGARLEASSPARVVLTGDVGTGKTAVLLAAAAQAIAAGKQVAILAPTTILAEQYVDACAPLVRATKARVARLPRAVEDRKGHARVAAEVARGDVDVMIGTHGILGDGIALARPGLAIVDEQHRLGVAQRLAFGEKGSDAIVPHLLSVSATPIPRTLALVLRGEIATVHLDERPPGRDTPATAFVPRARWSDVIEILRATIDRGERAFVVTARIERDDDDEGDVTPGAKARADDLARQFGAEHVALVHGSLDDDERREAVARFRSGAAPILVGTSMLEVGVDVPEATLMIVDGADRFGLAQLHQLRGRVGRGDRPGSCVLVHGEPLGELAKARLEAIVNARDGLEVARADLRLRGPGDLEGVRQAGEATGLRWLDPLADEAILREAAATFESIADHEGLRRAFVRFDDDARARDLGLARGEAG